MTVEDKVREDIKELVKNSVKVGVQKVVTKSTKKVIKNLKEKLKEKVEAALKKTGPEKIDKKLDKSIKEVTDELVKDNVERGDFLAKVETFEKTLTEFVSSLSKAFVFTKLMKVAIISTLAIIAVAFIGLPSIVPPVPTPPIEPITPTHPPTEIPTIEPITPTHPPTDVPPPSEGWIEGRVVNPDGDSIGGVHVRTVDGPSSGSDETNREGYYKLDNLEPGSYGIEANIPGCGVQRIDDIDVRSGEGVRRDFQVSGGFIEGKVLMRDDGPMGGVHVYTEYGPSSRSVYTDDDGYYKLENLIPGSYGIEADIPDCGVQRIDEIDVRSGEGVWRDFKVSGGFIEGKVLYYGDPVGGAPVYTVYGPSSGSVETNPEGYYKLDNLMPGIYGIEARFPDDYAQRIDSIDVRCGKGVLNDFEVELY